jgi:hypothetical protein
MSVGQPKDIIVNETMNLVGGESLEPVNERALNADFLDALAFMEEPVEIMVAETTDENAENPVQVGVNGQFQVFWRGVPTVTKRKFADALIVKSHRVSTPEMTNGSGERVRVIRRHAALKYPFSIMQDKNPKGTEWLRRRMAED